MPGCHSGCCRPRQGTSAGTSSVGCGLQVPVYLWPTASCRLRRLGYLLAVTDAASLRVRISPGQERSRTWSENGNTGVGFTPPRRSEGNAGASMSATMASTISRGILRQRRRSRNGTWYKPWAIMVSSSPKKRIMDPAPDDTVANASCQAVRRVNAARYLKTCPSARFVAGEQI
jgi:hypothetical protein